ncbi:MAG: hypothetical protein AAGA29_07530 [Planctomycetota bacterium]
MKLLACLSLFFALALVGCGQSPESELSGAWSVTMRFGQSMPEGVTETRTFHRDGTLTIARSDMDETHTVGWSVVGEWRMRIDPGDESDAPANDYTYRIADDTLTIAGEQGDTVLVRVE